MKTNFFCVLKQTISLIIGSYIADIIIIKGDFVSNYFIAKNGEQSGPFTLDDIVNQLGTATLNLTDYIYDESVGDWIMLMAHKELNKVLNNKKPSLPPPGITVTNVKLEPVVPKLQEQATVTPKVSEVESPPPTLADAFVPPVVEATANDVELKNTPLQDLDEDTKEFEVSAIEENTTEIEISVLNKDKKNIVEKKNFVEAFDNVSNCVYQEKINEIKNGKGSIKEKALKISRALEEVADPIMSEWYILKDDNKYGPYTYKDMLNMLDEKFIYGFDFVWHKSLSNWRRLADLEAFTYENINKLKNTYMPGLTQVYYKRRHKRVNYGHSIMIHDNNRVWKAKSVQIGQGGVGVLMDQTHVVSGQTLYLHFQPGDGVPPFNAVCEVVSKRLQENKETKKTEVFYGMKFIKISNDIANLVSSISKNKKTG